MEILATIKSIKTEGGKIRALVSFSDGSEHGYMFDPETSFNDIQIKVSEELKAKNLLVQKLAELQENVQAVIEISKEDSTKSVITRADQSQTTVTNLDVQDVGPAATPAEEM